MTQMAFSQKGKYKGFTVDTHDEIVKKAEKLSETEVTSLWAEYEHQFKNPPTLAHKIIAWIHLQAFTQEVMDRLLWDYATQRPKKNPTAMGQGNPARKSGKSDPDAYMRADYYDNPNYGWCGE